LLLREGLRRIVLGLVIASWLDFVRVDLEGAVTAGVAWVAAIVAKVIFLLVLLLLYR
jgi:hypothetical protein